MDGDVVDDISLDTLDRQQPHALDVKLTDHMPQHPHPLTSPHDVSTSPQHTPTNADDDDGTSIRSMPTVQVSQPPAPTHRTSPSEPQPSLLPARPPPPSPTPTTGTNPDDAPLAHQQRRARHRSAIEPRSNRLSGFFTNLIHRREHGPSSSRDPIRENPSSSDAFRPPSSENPSRSSSPSLPRPSTPPPPPLPPPSLHELGLSLAPMTPELSPSHFSAPPHSGAFLSPHYLLLCHAQGLDVLPLSSPPAPQPYALIRRVHFKSVVVMEQRGVLVAIAGRRDGVRVYALEEVKKAIEWRMDVESKRERDRQRRENTKKLTLRYMETTDARESADKQRKTSLSTPPPGETDRPRSGILKKSSLNPLPIPASPPTPPPPVPLIPRSATQRIPKKRPKTPTTDPSIVPTTLIPSGPAGQPPPYSSPSEATSLRTNSSIISTVSRSTSNDNVINVRPARLRTMTVPPSHDTKDGWEASDDEAIDPVAAGPSGEHLDQRTSTTLSTRIPPAPLQPIVPIVPIVPQPGHQRTLSSTNRSIRRNRPSDLDLSLARNPNIAPSEPSPAPTLLTLRQALAQPSSPQAPSIEPLPVEPDEEDDDVDEVDGRISLAQALLESRVPDLPPAGTVRPQEPILITPSHPSPLERSAPSSPLTQTASLRSTDQQRRRRRWSIMISSPASDAPPSNPDFAHVAPLTAPATDASSRFTRSQSFRSHHSHQQHNRTQPQQEQHPTRSATEPIPHDAAAASSVPDFNTSALPSATRSRFIPQFLSNAFSGRRSDERSPPPNGSASDPEGPKWPSSTPQNPPPKLEYVKLPGTKSALMIKAVETAKKSFLAILCGDNGEKVELFAGTYRTALGLSRTFILPDSPRSLELQLQGDDLVEVFLVFSQNIFGLEPATVRVREVRIDRAERRAARRRARERAGELSTVDNQQTAEEETNVNVSIGVSISSPSTSTSRQDPGRGEEGRSESPTLVASEHPQSQADRAPSPAENPATTNLGEDYVVLGTAQAGPYTTFQQLGFAPKFPLASIADEYIIPPTYASFVSYKAEYEPESITEQAQFSPPGLPAPPAPAAPTRWYYRDPKDVVHGPWKASLMQTWYKDSLLPPDLPVRREEDTEFILLRDLRAQCIDPTQPFKTAGPSSSPSTPPAITPSPSNQAPDLMVRPDRPLLTPISLLTQPRHFGPPALFFSSRGGHSTSIVDARGRSVLKGKLFWTADDAPESIPNGKSTPSSLSRLGDVKRLEAFDVDERSLLVAMRQGGLEVVDLGDALLKPADESRTVLPHYNPPANATSRRAPFIWRMGSPVAVPHHGVNGSIGATASTLPRSKQSTRRSNLGTAKTTSGQLNGASGDGEMEFHDEVLYLGRKDDEVYLCEKNTASFRILRLRPTTNDA